LEGQGLKPDFGIVYVAAEAATHKAAMKRPPLCQSACSKVKAQFCRDAEWKNMMLYCGTSETE
jgi:hypothetical protein